MPIDAAVRVRTYFLLTTIQRRAEVQCSSVTCSALPSDDPGRTVCAASYTSWRTSPRPGRSRRPPPPARPPTLSLGNCPGSRCCSPWLPRTLTPPATTLAPWPGHSLLNVLRRRPAAFIRQWGRHWHARCRPPARSTPYFLRPPAHYFLYLSFSLFLGIFQKWVLGQILTK